MNIDINIYIYQYLHNDNNKLVKTQKSYFNFKEAYDKLRSNKLKFNFSQIKTNSKKLTFKQAYDKLRSYKLNKCKCKNKL